MVDKPWEVNFKQIVVGSANPVKLDCVRSGLFKALHFEFIIGIAGLEVPSGVADQPLSDDETRLGAENRASRAYDGFFRKHGYHPDYAVGVEGGLFNIEGDMFCAAWVVIFDGKTVGKARSSAFPIPPAIASLVNQGIELGVADDRVFGRVDSKRGSGTVGHLTRGVITRSDFYVPAVILAYIPFQWKQLYSETIR